MNMPTTIYHALHDPDVLIDISSRMKINYLDFQAFSTADLSAIIYDFISVALRKRLATCHPGYDVFIKTFAKAGPSNQDREKIVHDGILALHDLCAQILYFS